MTISSDCAMQPPLLPCIQINERSSGPRACKVKKANLMIVCRHMADAPKTGLSKDGRHRNPETGAAIFLRLLIASGVSFSLAFSACGGSNTKVAGTPTPTPTPQPQMPTSHHVVMVMEENQSYTTVAGNTTAWPHLNALLKQGAQPTNYYADAHFSIPNYFMLTTGQIPTTDDNSITVWNIDNIARRMLAANVTFKVYAEGVKQGYLGGNTGLYVIRHNPFAMLSDVANNAQVASQVIQPFSQFLTDANNKALPAFSFIVPDLNDDAHNGTPLAADSWLQSNVISPLAANPAFQTGGDGLLIVDFDEAATSDVTHGGGHVVAAFWGPIAKAGYTQTSTTVYQHQSMLRTVMEVLSLTNPPGAAAAAPDMSEFFVLK
jgi:acid phosphatase